MEAIITFKVKSEFQRRCHVNIYTEWTSVIFPQKNTSACSDTTKWYDMNVAAVNY